MASLTLLLLLVSPMILVSYAGTGQKTFIFRVSGGTYEKIEVDLSKKSEAFSLQQASSGKRPAVVVCDFERNMTMFRLSNLTDKACFLRYSIGNCPRPDYLVKLLKLAANSAEAKLTTTTEEKLKVVGKLRARSARLSDKMKTLCAGLEIYQIKEMDPNENDADEQMDKQVQQSDAGVGETVATQLVKKYVCEPVCKHVRVCLSLPAGLSCSWRGCRMKFRRYCNTIRTLCPTVCAWGLVQVAKAAIG